MAKNIELALRIGVAARDLPGIESKTLVAALEEMVGAPFSAHKFSKITPEMLAQTLGLEVNEGVTAAARCLADGLDDNVAKALAPQYGQKPKAEGSVRVAFASNKEGQMDGHFGSCKQFIVYDITADSAEMVESRGTLHLLVEDSDPDPAVKNTERARMMSDCDLMYLCSIGGPAAAKVVRSGAHPLKIPTGGAIDELIAGLQEKIRNNPPPWLAKAMGIQPTLSFTDEDDDWDEEDDAA
ncbi:NifB/NifX family molybdenum-iron cluster-binding protein [Magnetofaba australis]|uniref:Putative dinitrogenase iron-molybdenum cofactor biosynthesis nifY n=1 Tax=Magnetofaba australis IT-1 TaxID=1434232 RepID=A0A1Y2K6F1_9PROT|nr:NifB/NifX family molybdenum-iron cluster-binding protein [Magnetofaba australis]OSM04011.1 putative dinitrogenase iron-molybdenum cofactor biosynthesis nifY [Magnetofaba australis IT-1]